jgi:ribosome-associated toxin RatA of RatAB toxin-antitoxin module
MSAVRSETTHEAVHGITIAAPLRDCYQLVLDVTRWPLIFAPTVHVEHLERDAHGERFHIWALANGDVADWTSRRTFDPAASRIGFEQEHSQPPVAAMRGEWSFRPAGDGGTEATLRHWFRAVDDSPDDVTWIRRVLDRNSTAELAGLRAVAELDPPLSDVRCSFEDVVDIRGGVEDAYRFVYEADRWRRRLPHVRRVDVTEDRPGVQLMEMDTVTGDGTVHTTGSVRACLPNRLIAYKQTVLPKLLTGHCGQWRFEETGTGTRVTAAHSVLLSVPAIPEVLGRTATLADAREFAREALGGNSRTTLAYTRSFAEEHAGHAVRERA